MGNDIKKLLIGLRPDMTSINRTIGTVNNSVNNMVRGINNNVKTSMNNMSSSVNKGSNAIMGGFKKIGAALAVALSISAIKKFGSACINLASDLSEVQNVVDVTFGSNAEIINRFAKTASTAFGLSELAAKKYTGTIGAMLKSMGLTSSQATDMSVKIASLAGDFASFYNLDTDKAFEKIRSGISGETEPLKQLGINMSVANLEAFALTQGIRKQYKAMAEQEKALLRYNYLLSVTKDAQGDFANTSDNWANQVRVLKLNFDSFKATLGQAFINVLTPVLQVLNKLIATLNNGAVAFSNFIANITGNTKNATNAVGSVAKAVGDVGIATSDAVKDSANSAVKAAKSAMGAIGGLDELVTLDKDKGAEDVTPSVPTSMASELTNGTVDNAIEKTGNKFNSIFNSIKETVKEIGNTFKENFINRLDGVNFDNIKVGLGGILGSIKDIGKGTSVSLKGLSVSMAGAYGGIAGSITKVGIGIGESLIGGIDNYLSKNKGRLTSTLNNIFVSLGDYFTNASSIVGSVGDFIYGFFTDSNTQKAVGDCISILGTLVLEPAKLVSQFLADGTGEVATFLDNMKPMIQESFGAIADIIQGVTGTIDKVVTDVFTKIGDVYNEYVKPALTNFREGFELIATAVSSAWNEHIYPMVKGWITEFNRVYDAALKPLIDNIIEFVGKLVENVSVIYKKFIAPIVAFLYETLAPAFSLVFGTIGDIVGTAVELIAGILGGLIKAIGGIIDFIVGVFTGDWNKAWEGLKNVVVGIWDALLSILKAPINLLIDGLNFLIGGVNKFSIDVPDWVPVIGGKKFGFDIPKIPKLADGGIVTQATQFIAGEAGAEVVFPLQNSKFIMDFAKYVADAMGNTRGNNNGGINFNVGTLIQDDRSYEWLADMMAKFMARNGILSNPV